jgi:hypothetical protein
MKELKAAQPERVEFVVLRGVRTHFPYVEPEWNPVAKAEDAPAKEEPAADKRPDEKS